MQCQQDGCIRDAISDDRYCYFCMKVRAGLIEDYYADKKFLTLSEKRRQA
jgi:hypothetical protein